MYSPLHNVQSTSFVSSVKKDPLNTLIASDYRSELRSVIISLHILDLETEDVWSSSSNHISSWMGTKDLHTFQMRSDGAQYGPRATSPLRVVLWAGRVRGW